MQDLIKKYTAEILDGVSIQKMMTMNMMQVNKDAVILAQAEYLKTI